MKELKPFDLEAAKRGEEVLTCVGDPVHFIGVSMDGFIVCQYKQGAILQEWKAGNLRMAPKKRTVWVNLYPDGKAFWFDEPVKSSLPVLGTAIPVEIEE